MSPQFLSEIWNLYYTKLYAYVSLWNLPASPFILEIINLKVKYKRTRHTGSLSDCWRARYIAFCFLNDILKSSYFCCTDSFKSEQFIFFFFHECSLRLVRNVSNEHKAINTSWTVLHLKAFLWNCLPSNGRQSFLAEDLA